MSSCSGQYELVLRIAELEEAGDELSFRAIELEEAGDEPRFGVLEIQDAQHALRFEVLGLEDSPIHVEDAEDELVLRACGEPLVAQGASQPSCLVMVTCIAFSPATHSVQRYPKARQSMPSKRASPFPSRTRGIAR